MPEPLDRQAARRSQPEPLDERIRCAPGLARLVAEAETTWRARALAAGNVDDGGATKPGWRTFEDAFPTFYEFTNRPR
jgi:hypothetical protein